MSICAACARQVSDYSPIEGLTIDPHWYCTRQCAEDHLGALEVTEVMAA